MGQVKRSIKGNPALDNVDHALGRPFRPRDSYRNHYATTCPKQIAEMRSSAWWREGHKSGDMVFFHVSPAGISALERELGLPEYGRLYELSRRGHGGSQFVMARSRSAARYAAFLQADLTDWSFMEFCDGLSVRLARTSVEGGG